jgi:hypothetical protein
MNANAQFIGFVDSWSGLPLVGGDWDIVGTGDFNNDLRPDIVWQSQSTNQFSIWYGNATCQDLTGQANETANHPCTPSYTSSPGFHFASDEFRVAGVADFNGDGTSDIMMEAGGPTSWDRKIDFYGTSAGQSFRFTDHFNEAQQIGALGNYAPSFTGSYLYHSDLSWAPPFSAGSWQFSRYVEFEGYNDSVSVPTGGWGTYYIAGPR